MKNLIKQFWRIECTEGMNVHYKEEIPVSHMKEPALKSILSFLVFKYALTDQEVAEQYTTRPFKKKKEYFQIQRRNSNTQGRVHISFSAELSSISVTATLIEK